MTRRSRRYAVAFVLGCDVGDVAPYQPGRTRVPVFLAGDIYFVALRAGEHVPEQVADDWRHIADSYGYRILRSVEAGLPTPGGVQ